jgi:hypothetical protein
VADEIDADHAMIRRERRRDLVPPVDRGAETVDHYDGRPGPGLPDIRCNDRRLYDPSAAARHRRPGPRIDDKRVRGERDGNQHEDDEDGLHARDSRMQSMFTLPKHGILGDVLVRCIDRSGLPPWLPDRFTRTLRRRDHDVGEIYVLYESSGSLR